MKKIFEKYLSNAGHYSFELKYWDGTSYLSGDEKPEFTIHFNTKGSLRRTLGEGGFGFGEEYAHKNIEVTGDILEMFKVINAGNLKGRLIEQNRGFVYGVWNMVLNATLGREQVHIEHHYNLDENFYKYYLDDYRQYSCGYFRNRDDKLEKAQEQKLDYTLQKLQLKEGESLIDIGCGWGDMLITAAQKYGIKGLGISLSPKQVEVGNKRAKMLNLPIEFKLMNYQQLPDLKQQFDKIVSVGMCCHVGRKKMPAYYDVIYDILAPQGLALIHNIAFMDNTPTDKFTRKYIFPGGYLNSVKDQTRWVVERDLNINDLENLRIHYSWTIEHWYKRFEQNWEAMKSELGFDESFLRTWYLWLVGSCAGFRYGDLNLVQMVISKGLNNDINQTREHLYKDHWNSTEWFQEKVFAASLQKEAVA